MGWEEEVATCLAGTPLRSCCKGQTLMMAVCWGGAGLTSGASWGAGEGEGTDEDDAAADMGCNTEMALGGQEIAVRSRRSCCRFGCFSDSDSNFPYESDRPAHEDPSLNPLLAPAPYQSCPPQPPPRSRAHSSRPDLHRPPSCSRLSTRARPPRPTPSSASPDRASTSTLGPGAASTGSPSTRRTVWCD